MSGADPPGAGDRDLPATLVMVLERACDRFEAAWKAGLRPQVEDYLGEMPAAGRAALLRELLLLEVALRPDRGERPSLAEYTARYPELAAEIHELFPVLLEMEDARLEASEPGGPFPERLGDYRLLRELGRGGMGIVYEAEQESLGRRVALKVLARAALTPQQVRRFEREARSAGKLHHTNIVPVFGVGREGSIHYYVMQYIPGRPLDEVLKEVRRLRRRGPERAGGAADTAVGHRGDRPSAAEVARSLWSGPGLVPAGARGVDGRATPAGSPDPSVPGLAVLTTLAVPALPIDAVTPAERAVTASAPPAPPDADVLSPSADLSGSGLHYARAVARIGVQVAEALDYAAEQGVIHRDIKPSNILLDLLSTAWVTDFGLAKMAGQEDLTYTGDLVGTLRYMAPERFRGQADRRSDVYALGLTLYELLALRPAYDESDRGRLISQVAEEDPPRLTRLDPAIPRDLATVVHKAMAREPAQRYATAGALAADLKRFLEDRPIVARRPSLLDRAAKWSRRYRAAVSAGAAGLVVALAILFGGLGWILRDRAARSELTERRVNLALLEAADFQGRAKWPEALEAAKRADGFLAVGGSETLRQRIGELRKDLEMVLRLEGIRLPRPIQGTEGGYDNHGADASYAQAFRGYGIDVEALEPSKAAERIRARVIRRELMVSLDYWAMVRKDYRPASDASWKRLVAVARAADPDEWRNRVRDAVERNDREALIQLAASARVSDLPVQTASLLGRVMDVRHAQSLLRRVQRAHSDDFWINFQLAWALDFAPRPHQDLDEAIRFYTAALAVRPRNAPTHYFLGEALRHRGRRDEAIAEHQKAIEMDPNFSRPRFALGSAYLEQGRLDEAIAECRRAIERDPADAGAHDLLALALARHSRLDEAIREYETVVALQPNNAEALNDLAWTLATCPDPRWRDARRAVELGKRAVELAPKKGAYRNTLGVALYRAGNWDGAIAALEKSIAVQGHNSFDWFFLAMARWKRGEREEARRLYDKSVRWMKRVKPNDKELGRFRAEAAALLQLEQPAPSEKKGPG